MLLALFEPTVALRRVLENGAPGYSIRVLCRNEELFPALPGDAQPQPDRFWRAAEVALSLSPPWTVAVHPTAMLVGGVRYQGATVALVAGLMISALLAALVHLGQVARSRAVSLVRVDADLRESIDETEREETEIRELRGALETRVTERTATMQETIEELETFNYSVSHDLRSPIGAVINFAAILQHDYGDQLDESAKDCLDRISASAKVAVSLMDGLLAFSRSGREEIHKVSVDMRDLVEGVRDDLSAADASAGAAIQIGELPDALRRPRDDPPRVHEPDLERAEVRSQGRACRASTWPATHKPAKWSTSCATRASASTCATRRSSSACSSACTRARSSQATASGSRSCRASSAATADASGRRAPSGRARPSCFRCRNEAAGSLKQHGTP